ncbi:MAG: alpha/beta hydrolase [Actinomycetota bacterium]
MAADKMRTMVVDAVPETEVVLADRGPVWIRHHPGPPDRPTVLLLHGWTATADLNWGTSYQALARRGGVIALDHRGHGRGLRGHTFTLEACADDAADVVRALGVERVVVVGYSMGGTVAQLIAHRHPDLTAGLVLAATAATFSDDPRERAMFAALAGITQVARVMPADLRAAAARRIVAARSGIDIEDIPDERRHDWLNIAEAGTELGRFDSRRWLHEVSVPTANLVTVNDYVISMGRQLELAEHADPIEIIPVHGTHRVPINVPTRFVPRLVHAIDVVADRQANIAATSSAATRTTSP